MGFASRADSELDRLQELVVCLSYAWGGLEQVALNDATDRAHAGMKVRFLCLRGSPVHEKLVRRPEVTPVALDFRPRDYFDLKLRKELMQQFDSGVNLVHCHQTSLLGSVTPWLWGRPEVAAFASRHIMNNHNKRNFFHRAVYGRLDSLIVMSQTLRQNVLDTHPLSLKQVSVVNLGLDFERFDPAKVDRLRTRAAWGVDDGTVVIGLVGRIDPAKGQEIFIKAAAGLLKHPEQEGRSQPRLKFILVGEETLGQSARHLEELKRMVEQFRLGDSVYFAGYQDNIPEVMAAFDILVMPSRQEAFGLVAIEALAMECPTIISRGGSAEEIVGDQDFGFLVRPEDAFDLQRQLRSMIGQPQLRRQMGQAGRLHVLHNYDQKVRLQKTLGLYGRALRKRRQFT